MSGQRQGPLSPTARLDAELFAPVTAEASGTKATMRVYGRIDPDGAPWGISAADFQTALDAIPDSVTEVEVQIHSRGGDAFEGFAIMNGLRAMPQATEAVVVGLAASAASYIAQGADKVTMAPHSQMMIHRGSALAIGQAPDMRALADRLDAIDANMAGIYADKAGGTSAEWLDAMTPESWYSADEAVKIGLADGLRENAAKPDAVKASLDLSVFAYAGRDAAPEPYMPAHPEPPAEPQGQPNPKEADEMSDTILAGLRKRLGAKDDADEATVLAALDEALAERADPPPDPAPNMAGKVLVDEAQWRDVVAQAALGAKAHAQQDAADRDKVIDQARKDGKISAALVDDLRKDWDADVQAHGNADQTRKRIEDMAVIYPVAASLGYLGEGDKPGPEARADEDKLIDAQFSGTVA